MDQQPFSQGQGYNTPPQGFGPQGQQPGYMQQGQQNYMPPQQPMYNNAPYMNDKTAPMTMGQYLIMFLILLIPLVNLVMPFVWAFGDTNVNKKNLSRAMLVMMAIGIVFAILLSSVLASVLSSVLRNM